MKLNTEQVATIKQLVFNEVEFNETYLEVYDHMVTALENCEAITDIQKAYAEILEQDFGGHSGLEKIEQIHQKIIKTEMKNAKWSMFRWFFKWPVLPFSILAIGLFYKVASIANYRMAVIVTVLIIAFLPWLSIAAANFFTGLKYTEIKRSIRSKAVDSMSGYMFDLYWKVYVYGFLLQLLVDIINKQVHVRFPVVPFEFTITACFTFCTLHTIAVLKIYCTEYKKGYTYGTK